MVNIAIVHLQVIVGPDVLLRKIYPRSMSKNNSFVKLQHCKFLDAKNEINARDYIIAS